jgi:hypothetical protein
MTANAARSARRGYARGLAVLLAMAVLALPSWLIHRSVILPWRMADQFFAAVAVAPGPDALAPLFAPDRARSCCSDAPRWIADVRAMQSWSFAREATSLGTTRGGKSLVSLNGYLHYPGSTDESWFSITFIEIEGRWWIDSFSLGQRETPR